jgi:hypothetical protein
LVDAQIPFYDFLTRFDKEQWMNEGEHDFDTLAGFILHELEHIPKTGEKLTWKGFIIEIIDMDNHRIDKVLVKISEELRDEMDEGCGFGPVPRDRSSPKQPQPDRGLRLGERAQYGGQLGRLPAIRRRADGTG